LDKGQEKRLLEDSEEKFRLIFEDAPLGAIHFNQDGIITACNSAFVDIIGSSRDVLIGLNMLNLPDIKVTAAVQEALNGRNGFYSGLYHSVTAKKSTPVRAYFKPFFTNKGEKSGGIGIVEDTTWHEQATLEIAHKQAYFEQLFQASPEGIVILDTNDCIVRFNHAFGEMFGYDFDEVSGKPINSVIVPDHLKEEGSSLTKQAETGIVGHETIRKKKDGSLIQVSILASPITLPGGTLALYGIYRDISRQKETEKELVLAKEKAEQSDRLKSAFLNNLSHEVRTPMNAITGFSNLLRDKDLDKEQIRRLTNVIFESSQQLLSVIDSIVRISAIEAGFIEIHEKPFNLHDLLKKVFLEHEEKALKKKIRFRYHSMVSDKDHFVVSDESKIYQTLSIFVENAIKFTEEGHVEFGCNPAGDNLRFYVADTGCGIAPEYHTIIFERFRQADLSGAKLNSGMGLGLPIAKAYVEAMGGTIRIDTTDVSGTVFTFSIPWKKPVHTETDKEKPRENRMTEKKTVLVVEDEEYNFYLTREILNFKNIHVIHAWNGKEAVSFVEENPGIDLVLMDIKMPIMGGYEATRLIKEQRPELPVVALTAYALLGDREKALQNGCDDYLAKPVSMKDFEAVVDKYLL
jgi:two-component system, sensor histidine kinase and response regulator